MDPIGAVALGTALKTGAISAGVPLALRGISALTPAAREARKLSKQEREAAIKAVQRGEKYGFGPSKRKRENEVASRMRMFRSEMAPQMESIQRQEAQLGFGRSAALAPVRERVAKVTADTLGQARAAVEAKAEQIAERREAAARNRLARAMGALESEVAERRQFITQVGAGAVTAGLQSYAGSKAASEAATQRSNELKAMIAATQGADALKAYDESLKAAAADTATG